MAPSGRIYYVPLEEYNDSWQEFAHDQPELVEHLQASPQPLPMLLPDNPDYSDSGSSYGEVVQINLSTLPVSLSPDLVPIFLDSEPSSPLLFAINPDYASGEEDMDVEDEDEEAAHSLLDLARQR